MKKLKYCLLFIFIYNLAGMANEYESFLSTLLIGIALSSVYCYALHSANEDGKAGESFL